MANNTEDFLTETRETEGYGDEMLQIDFGSNRCALVEHDDTVMFNTFGLEQMHFKTLEDFAKWYFDDDKTVEFGYQIYLGRRADSENEDDEFEDEDSAFILQDDDEDGSDIWSVIITVKDDDRGVIKFPKNTLKSYRVMAEMSVMYETTIEANSLEEAREMAREVDGGTFSEVDGGSSWTITDVLEEED